MSLEVKIQQSVTYIKEHVKESLYSDIVKNIRDGKVKFSIADVPGLIQIINNSIDSSVSRSRVSLSKILTDHEKG
jgi:hypothetical protein